MEFLILYGVSAFAIAIIANITFISHSIKVLHNMGVENLVTEHPVLLHLSTFCIHFLIAPIMAWVILSTDKSDRMKAALVDVLAQD